MTSRDPSTDRAAALRLFGWCLPGPEVNHEGCRASYVSDWDGAPQVCECGCHG